jgi:hypothetical protein
MHTTQARLQQSTPDRDRLRVCIRAPAAPRLRGLGECGGFSLVDVAPVDVHTILVSILFGGWDLASALSQRKPRSALSGLIIYSCTLCGVSVPHTPDVVASHKVVCVRGEAYLQHQHSSADARLLQGLRLLQRRGRQPNVNDSRSQHMDVDVDATTIQRAANSASHVVKRRSY